MKGILTLKKSAVIAAVCLAVLCLPGYSEPTPEQVKERTKLLIQAVQNNNVEQAKVCIKFGANVNATFSHQYDRYGNYIGVYNTLLTYAVEYYCKDITKLLIESGADVNVTTATYKGITVLMRAASREDWKDITELLIKSGADVNAKADDGWTALMYAAGHKDTAELLIKAGADVNAKDNNGRTALMFAASADTAELLIKAGADVNTKNGNGWSALRFATSKYLNHYYDTNIKDNIYKDMAELLIKAGADVDSELIYEIQNGSDTNYTNCVELLLQLGANPNATDSEGISALDNAILYGKNDIADLLRAAGAKE